ncbi:hypothetical protein [Candidatus Pantoea formicae]|uniref:hypothetical protein n=1 Tax=Candidatus Pantoea formicae TaxID=2608355 RepID=UPI003EDA0F95
MHLKTRAGEPKNQSTANGLSISGHAPRVFLKQQRMHLKTRAASPKLKHRQWPINFRACSARLLKQQRLQLKDRTGQPEEQSVRAKDGAADLHGCVLSLRSGWPVLALAPNSQRQLTHSDN